MSLGLPAHLAPNAVRRAFVTAQHAIAFTLLVISLMATMVFQSAQPSAVLWPSTIATLPMIGLLLVVDRIRTVPWLLSFLVVGGLAVHLYALTILSQPVSVDRWGGFSFLAIKVVLIMAGGVVLGVGAGILGSIAGYIIAELAVALASVELARPLYFDVPTFFALLVTIAAIIFISVDSPWQMWVLPSLRRAAHDEHLAALRYKFELRAATLMHDTVLNHLAAIADSGNDVLDQDLRQQIQQDVGSLTGEAWLAAKPERSKRDARSVRDGWHQSGLYIAIQESRILGLTVLTTGDLTSISRLDPETSRALGLAVKQCLVNVVKHAGTREAEVAVYPSESEVSVMVVDTGCGFVEASTGADRLGLRSSVRQRIGLVGGTVNVWSTPGRGTSIMIKVPTAPDGAASLRETAMELP